MNHGDGTDRGSNGRLGPSTGSGTRGDVSNPQLEGGTSATFSFPSQSNEPSNIRPYISKIDRIVNSFRAGERSRFEVITAITQLLNGDEDLSPQERSQSFNLYLAEIEEIEVVARGKGKGKPPGVRGLDEGKLSKFGALKEHGREGDVSSGGESSPSSESGEEEPRKRRKL